MDKLYDLIKIVHTVKGDNLKVLILLKKVREEKKLTLQQLAKITGISASHLNYIERGERKATIDTLCALANALKVNVCELFEYIP